MCARTVGVKCVCVCLVCLVLGSPRITGSAAIRPSFAGRVVEDGVDLVGLGWAGGRSRRGLGERRSGRSGLLALPGTL